MWYWCCRNRMVRDYVEGIYLPAASRKGKGE
jgi:hypothetical protein